MAKRTILMRRKVVAFDCGMSVLDCTKVWVTIAALLACFVSNAGGAPTLYTGAFTALLSDKPSSRLPLPAPDIASRTAASQDDRIIGWISGVSAADGVISGWAVDSQHPDQALTISFYAYAPPSQGGTLMGTTLANAVDFSVLYMHGFPGAHRFVFPIPEEFKRGKATTFYAQAANADRSESQLLSGMTKSFNLNPIARTSAIKTASCLAPRSKCASTAYDFGPPNFPWATGADDGKDYFKIWGCTSSVGLNHILHLNIIPYGSGNGTKYHDENFQKDSLLVNFVDEMFGSPIIYFTSSRYNTYSTVFSLKKAAYGPRGDWQILDMLDYPSNSGGFSSLDGRYPSFVMNDYSQPGWGPTSPFPGSYNYVPGVANVAVNPEHNSFALVGTGTTGLTAIVNTLQGPGLIDGGVQGRTCLHMNPKLFDYKAGVPQSMIAYLFQEASTGKPSPCVLPDGSALPRVGYYVYHFQGALGWQLDRSFGPVDSSPDPDQALKLLSGADSHVFIGGNWNGQITTIDLDDKSPRTRKVILSCVVPTNGSSPKFGEATGNLRQVWFLAIPPDAPLTYGNGVFTGDIYYAYAGSNGRSRDSYDPMQ